MALAAILNYPRSEIWGKTVSETSFLVSVPHFVRKNMCKNYRVVAVKVNFKMAAAAILDFVESEF